MALLPINKTEKVSKSRIAVQQIDLHKNALSGDYIDGGTITNFNSSGIKDEADSVNLTIKDDVVEVQTDLNVKGTVRVENLEYAVRTLSDFGKGKILALAGDVSVEKDCDRMIKASLDEFDTIDILITNSGGPPSGNFDQFSLNDWEAAYHLLLGSTLALIKGFLPQMKAQKWGRIVAITSQAVKQPVDGLILSNSVRAAVSGLIKSLSNELGSYNITVNNLLPGYTET